MQTEKQRLELENLRLKNVGIKPEESIGYIQATIEDSFSAEKTTERRKCYF